jgi:hypothetical protein
MIILQALFPLQKAVANSMPTCHSSRIRHPSRSIPKATAKMFQTATRNRPNMSLSVNSPGQNITESKNQTISKKYQPVKLYFVSFGPN